MKPTEQQIQAGIDAFYANNKTGPLFAVKALVELILEAALSTSPAGVGVEAEWKAAWIARGTVVAFPGGGFDVSDCPDPEQLAIFIAEAVNAYRPRASLKGDEQ